MGCAIATAANGEEDGYWDWRCIVQNGVHKADYFVILVTLLGQCYSHPESKNVRQSTVKIAIR
ncbi:hypothetical protein AHiyo6_06490 [Arthrobacter sp. Hiyo6]|nr:hypothetical protein AHiyo6_06490 [Arthrobacter sp. Hiyo6]